MDDYNPRTRYEHYYVRMARLEGRGELQKRYPDDFYVRPFQIAGNVYYIGNKAVCSHLIDTGEGLIVIDTSYPELDHLLINSIWEAGFDPKDIRIVLHTHLHYDHFGATNTLTKIYGAKAYGCRLSTWNAGKVLFFSGVALYGGYARWNRSGFLLSICCSLFS